MINVDVSPRDNGSDPLPHELVNATFTTTVGQKSTDAEGKGLEEASIGNEQMQSLVVSESLLPDGDRPRIHSGARFSTW